MFKLSCWSWLPVWPWDVPSACWAWIIRSLEEATYFGDEGGIAVMASPLTFGQPGVSDWQVGCSPSPCTWNAYKSWGQWSSCKISCLLSLPGQIAGWSNRHPEGPLRAQAYRHWEVSLSKPEPAARGIGCPLYRWAVAPVDSLYFWCVSRGNP